MKKAFIFCLAALLALSVCACAPEAGSTYTVTKNGTDYVVDQENGTISDGTYTYQYTFSGTASSYSVEITYPDGSTYWWSRQRNSDGTGIGCGGRGGGYDEDRYVSGDVLRDILEEKAPRETDGGRLFLGLFLLAAGLFNVITPHTAWYLRYGWRYKDTEPSELALTIGRLGGGAVVVIAVILILSAW